MLAEAGVLAPLRGCCCGCSATPFARGEGAWDHGDGAWECALPGRECAVALDRREDCNSGMNKP